MVAEVNVIINDSPSLLECLYLCSVNTIRFEVRTRLSLCCLQQLTRCSLRQPAKRETEWLRTIAIKKFLRKHCKTDTASSLMELILTASSRKRSVSVSEGFFFSAVSFPLRSSQIVDRWSNSEKAEIIFSFNRIAILTLNV